MSISEGAKRALRELGLTTYETRAYLSLIKKGTMTASQVSEYADVPYSKIYETLNSLKKKGWVEVEEGRPSQYCPKSPSEALEAAKLRFESMIKSWEQNVVSELQPLYEKREIREKPNIWIIRSEFHILAKLREMLNVAKNEVMIAAPVLSETLAEALYPMLSHLQSIGVRILFMVSTDVKQGIEKVTDIAEVRMRDHMFGGGVIVDDREVVLLLGEEGKLTLAIWADHVGLVKFAKDYFQYLWDNSRR